MTNDFHNAKLDDLVSRHGGGRQSRNMRFMYWVYLPAILFAVLGMLFAINFGLALIAIALAILYYSQYGQKVAAQLGAALLAMLAAWMLFMPPHYLLVCSFGIFLLAIGGRFATQLRAQGKSGFSEWTQYLLAGPVYALAMIR